MIKILVDINNLHPGKYDLLKFMAKNLQAVITVFNWSGPKLTKHNETDLMKYKTVAIFHTYPNSSTRSHKTFGVGRRGDPSYTTIDAPTANADTIQFHIIQPV